MSSGTEIASELNQAIDTAIADGQITGAEVLLVDGPVATRTVRGTSFGRQLDGDDIWWVASLTKPIVAAAVMVLVDEGRLAIDDEVGAYIPAFAGKLRVRSIRSGTTLKLTGPGGGGEDENEWDYSEADRAITLRDLLTMTSGFQTIMVANPSIPPVTPDDDLASFTAKLDGIVLDFTPGARWHYSNAGGYELLARVVEVVSGERFRDFVTRRLLKPLGMDSTTFGVPVEGSDRLLPLGPFAGNPVMGHRFDSGSAGLFSTASDYARFASMLLAGGAAGEARVLSEKAVHAMTSNQIGDLGLGGISPMQYGGFPETTTAALGYGYGLVTVRDSEEAGLDVPTGSFGWDGIASRRFWVDPSGKTVLIVFADGMQPDPVQRAIESVVFHDR
jgi:CubicO group peptidase (beta-lactamase class C family)